VLFAYFTLSHWFFPGVFFDALGIGASTLDSPFLLSQLVMVFVGEVAAGNLPARFLVNAGLLGGQWLAVVTLLFASGHLDPGWRGRQGQ
jgi:hypothetical protein